jgi:outer membrane protein assembly factor BamB
MHRLLCLAALGLAALSTQPSLAAEPAALSIAATDWPWWRGPQRNGIAAAGQAPPLQWSATENIRWKSPVPGRGHGSATVVGNQVFLTAADEERQLQSVLCFDRATGQELWRTEVHRGGLTTKGNKKSSQASTTVACDGVRVFVNFLNNDAVVTTALDRDGQQLWQTKISDFVVHQGYGASPAVYGPLVLVSADHKGEEGGAIAGLNRETGDVVWRHGRPATPNYTSPIVLHIAGRDQLIFTGCDVVSSFDPLSGEKLWEREGATTECVTSTVTDGRLVFSSGGYPRNHVCAFHGDGSGTIAWENNVRVYVPSMLIRDGFLYAVTDDGVAMCWRAATGEELWKGRLGGTFSSSPVLVGDHIYAINEGGHAFVFTASPREFELVAESQLGNEVFATPAICGNHIYLRVAELEGGRRQEYLYCIGQGSDH